MSPLLVYILLAMGSLSMKDTSSVSVPFGGNTYSSGPGCQIRKEGIGGNDSADCTYTVYVRFSKPGKVTMQLKSASLLTGPARVRMQVQGEVREISLFPSNGQIHPAGEWKVSDTGYVAMKLRDFKADQGPPPVLTHLQLSGNDLAKNTHFVRNDADNYFYWGRRGPSVHLTYTLPKELSVKWFYNELTVPEKQDVPGSFFMAAGFAEGYFGMQVNSESERRVLFSVWSPFHTDDPSSIPEEQKVKMLQKGPGVYTGEFGNEGAGGQSYLRYPWKAGTTYPFLLSVEPMEGNSTRYSAYFYAAEEKKWRLIATFLRPKTTTYLQRPHSFLENFLPEYGDQRRSLLLNRQWVADTQGNWHELTEARFTVDQTGRKGFRMDYKGGVLGKDFYMENGGFFSDFTPAGTLFRRPSSGLVPLIDLQQFTENK